MSGYKSTTLRDFAGGWNALDDDLNLAGSFQPVLDNIHRGLDNLLSVRWGYELFANLQDGALVVASANISISVTSGSREIVVSHTAHGFSNHDHVKFTDNITVGGLTPAELTNVIFGIYVTGADEYKIWTRVLGTSTATSTAVRAFEHDNHMLAGNAIELAYFSDHIVVVDTLGEIIKIDAVGGKTRIWDVSISILLTDNPIGWNACTFVSSDVFKGQLLVTNGLDKPLQIDFTISDEVQYLVDLGSGSNANVPVCRYIKAMGRWVVFAGDAEHPNRIHISSTDTSGTFFGDSPPNDALFIDVNYASNSPSFIIRGINKFREFVVVGFDDVIILLQLGIFDSASPPNHIPSINDTIARHGVIAHKSMAFLGFDLIMADPVGIPSLAKSQYDSSVIPARQSAVITPPLQRNIGRLSTATLEDKIFAVYNTHAFQYMLFMPDFDNDVINLGSNPLIVPESFIGTGKLIVQIRDHGMEEGNHFIINGVMDDVAGFDAACLINGVDQTVAGVLSEDYVLIELNGVSTDATDGGGGSGITLTRVFHDTTGYVFTYNRAMKVKTWARYRDMNFNCGTASVYGRVFLGTDHRIWRMGNQFEPIYADKYNDYDVIWANNTPYVAGIKAYDAVTNETYTALVNNTSIASGAFDEDRAANSDNWAIYEGEDIHFVMETPWADFNERTKLKVLDYFGMDARGVGDMTVMLFSDFFYRSKIDGRLQPQLTMDMVGGDAGGFRSEVAVGTRVATRQRLWPFPARGKLLKMRIEGQTKHKLKIVSMQFEYKLGNIYR